MTYKKGLAVISGSSNGTELKHRLLEDSQPLQGTTTVLPMATLGTTDVESTIHTTVQLSGTAGLLATALNAASGNVEQRIQTSVGDRNDIRTEADAIAVRLGATVNTAQENSGRYAYAAPASPTVDGTGADVAATSAADADSKISTKLSTMSGSILTLQSDENVAGSIDNSIMKYLRGAASGVALLTVRQLQDSLEDVETDLAGAITTELDALKSRITGSVIATHNNLDQFETDVSNHENNDVTTAKALVQARLDDVATVMGATTDAQGEYVYSVSVSGSTQDDDTPAAVTATSLRDADEKLNAAHAETRRRFKVFTETGISTADLDVDGEATFTGAVSFRDTTQDMEVPVYTNAAAVPQANVGDTQVVYLQVTPAGASYDPAVDGDSRFPVNNKFYFCEGSEWHPSPFHSE